MAICFWSLLGLAGCSNEGGNRQEIAGTVTLKGQPLDDGSIEFIPMASPSAGEDETRSGAPIMNGKYSIPRMQGLAPGKYRVRISAGTATPELAPGETPGPTFGPPSKERIPAEYNVKSTLEAAVTQSGPNTFDFEIP